MNFSARMDVVFQADCNVMVLTIVAITAMNLQSALKIMVPTNSVTLLLSYNVITIYTNKFFFFYVDSESEYMDRSWYAYKSNYYFPNNSLYSKQYHILIGCIIGNNDRHPN